MSEEKIPLSFVNLRFILKGFISTACDHRFAGHLTLKAGNCAQRLHQIFAKHTF